MLFLSFFCCKILNMTLSTTFNDLELGLGLKNCDNYDCNEDEDWGLFVILDQEEKQVSYRQIRKNIIQIETIEECEYETEETYGNKHEYYINTAINIYEKDQNDGFGDRNKAGNGYNYDHEQDQEDQDQEDYKNIVKEKIQFLITYALTTSFSIALIILTFTI